MKFLCDTNIISEVMRKSPNPNVEEWLNLQDIIGVSVITVEEIYWGLTYKDTKKQQKWLEEFLEFRCKILPITAAIAKRCGILRGEFRKKGIIRTQADLLIAATSYEKRLILVTRNINDFKDCELRLFNPFEME